MNKDDSERKFVEWGSRLFYPGVRRYGRRGDDPRLLRRRPQGVALRTSLRAVLQRSPEVVVKVTGGGRGMGAIKAHMLYISRGGQLEMETERGDLVFRGDEVSDLTWEWQHAGNYVPKHSHRREAFHVMLSMPPETDAQAVLWAARKFAETELARFKYAMVLHEPRVDPKSDRPHVHLIVRAQGLDGQRLNPRKADLARWRQVFADRLIERGVAASATRRQTRGILQPPKTLLDHHVGAIERKAWPVRPDGQAQETENLVIAAWYQVAVALGTSETPEDRALAREALEFMKEMPSVKRKLSQRERHDLSPEQSPASRKPRDGRERNRLRGTSR